MERKTVGYKRDLTGLRFDYLVVDKYVGNIESGHSTWECTCDCGEKIVKIGSELNRKGIIKSCGCKNKRKPRVKTEDAPVVKAAVAIIQEDKEFCLFGKQYSLQELSLKFEIPEAELKERIENNKDKSLADLLYP